MVIVWICAVVCRSCLSLMALSYCCWEICSSRVVMSNCYGVWSCFLETLSVCRSAIDAFVRAEGCVIDIEALFYAFGGARCAFVLFLGCRFCCDLCWGMFGFFFLSTGF